MVANRSRPPDTVIPTLFYEDVGGALTWLCEAFGFTERFRYGSDTKVEGAQLSAGGGAVMLSVARVGQSQEWGDSAEFRPPRDGANNVVLGVHIEDVDQHCERAKEFGARVVHEPETHPFGERQYTVEDLAGYRWSFSQSVADAAPEEWGGTSGPDLVRR